MNDTETRRLQQSNQLTWLVTGGIRHLWESSFGCAVDDRDRIRKAAQVTPYFRFLQGEGETDPMEAMAAKLAIGQGKIVCSIDSEDPILASVWRPNLYLLVDADETHINQIAARAYEARRELIAQLLDNTDEVDRLMEEGLDDEEGQHEAATREGA